MIDLSFTDEQKTLSDALRKFAKKDITPLIDEYREGAEYRQFIFKKIGEL